MKITMKKIAQESGVSITTVHRALNDRPRVSEATKRSILELARKYDYQPDVLAQSLVKKRTRSVGVVFGNFSFPIWVDLLDRIVESLKVNSYDFLLGTWKYIDPLIRGRVDGLIIAPDFISFKKTGFLRMIEKIERRKIPFVLLLGSDDWKDLDFVSTDRAAGAYKAVRHLIELGHRRIGFVSDPVGFPEFVIRPRLEGYRRALGEAGIPFDPGLIISIKSHNFVRHYYQYGYEVGNLIRKMSDRPTSIFFINDMTAIGALSSFREGGIKVPEDIAVVGFDGDEVSAHASVPLTTVAQPVEEIAERSVEVLLGKIESPSLPPKQVYIEPRFIVRRSCGAYLNKKS
jgi:LacI family transcriptional regulator